jgi:hypothetical protein
MKNVFITGYSALAETTVPNVSSKLEITDILGAIMVRWGINRDNYRITPGLYSVGVPDNSSDVFVTGNYKLSFDAVRKNLSGINGWILVLDTKGVNVWCAAGKGTFSTKELVNRINLTSLSKIVNHKRIIVPQLGATGVAAHKVKEETGFIVHYGPVRALDIKKFIDAGYRATKEMRKVSFNFADRIKLIPNDFVYGKFYLLAAFVTVFLISLLGKSQGINIESVKNGLYAIMNISIGYCAGVVITPVLLPWLPGRRFSLKGFFSGAITVIVFFFLNKTGQNLFEIIAWFMIIPTISSFMAMNFTGSSTYTSLSGVKKEMKTALPIQIILAGIGIILLIISKFLN